MSERIWINCTKSDMPRPQLQSNNAGETISSSLGKVLSMQLNGINFMAVFVVTFQFL